MRRFLSITTVVALFASMLSPTLSALCSGTGKVATCHMEGMESDAPMMHHHHAASSSKTASLTANDDVKCPMDCCTQGHPPNATTVTTAIALPLPALAGQKLPSASVIFSTPGFSSHTDRGPPRA